jgi:hypothetical protein
MRSTVVKVAFIAFSLSQAVFALDLSAYENQCADIGFKRKTQPFGECVLELRARGGTSARSPVNAVSQGDGTPDHSTCSRYGFNAGTTEYAQCRMQIDVARSQAEEQQRQYESQVAEQNKAKEKAKGEALLMLGLGMMAGGGQRQTNNSNFNIIQPPQMDRIYNLPGGKFMRCSTMGMVTNCQ